MKKNSSLLAALILLIGIFHVHAGTIFYQTMPVAQSDANCGISRDNRYTSAVDGGNTKGTDRVINGITLYAMAANGQSSTADNCALNALSGSVSNAGGASASIKADGACKEVLSDMTFNNGASDNSQQEIVLDPASLESGTTYDLRVYICNSAGQNRLVNLAFVGDGQPAIETGSFNEDDARTSAGGFKDANQPYYINYRFTWDGDSTPGITITQKSGSTPFVLYALTNQVVLARGAAAGVEGGKQHKVRNANALSIQTTGGGMGGSGGKYPGHSLRRLKSAQGGMGPTIYVGAGSEVGGNVQGGGGGKTKPTPTPGKKPTGPLDQYGKPKPTPRPGSGGAGGKPTGAWLDKDGNLHSGSQGTQTTGKGKKTKPTPTPGKKPTPRPGPLETPRDPNA
jgi:hypothetical protein